MNQYFILTCFVLSLAIVNVQSAAKPAKAVEEVKKVDPTIPLSAKLVEVTDTFAVINVTGPLTNGKESFGKLEFTLKTLKRVDGKNTWPTMDKGFNATIQQSTPSGNSKVFIQLLRLENLKAKAHYKIEIKGLYGKKTLVAANPASINLNMMANTPVGTLNKQVSLSLKGANPKTFFIQVDEILADNKHKNVIDATLDASLGSSTTLDGLKAGHKYQIKYWYICTQNKISPPNFIDYQA